MERVRYKGKRVYLVGAGLSGIDAAAWFIGEGAVVLMNDAKPFEKLAAQARRSLSELEGRGLALALGAPPDPLGWDADLVITSPGVPLDLPELAAARDAGIPLTNEIEIAWQASRARIVGVTGSNGKTTVTSLIGQIMIDAVFEPFIGGNIGTPFISAVGGLPPDAWAVLELSSFQLAGIQSLAPKVAVILNLSPDHLDWHKTYERYVSSKWNIARYQSPDDWLILNYDDPALREEGARRLEESGPREEKRGPRILWFSKRETPYAGVFVDEDGWAVYKAGSGDGERERLMPIDEFALPGSHNLENLLAALAAGVALGVAPGRARESARAFRALPHRMEPVAEKGGVLYVNDSKATNPDSAIKALDSYDMPIILIAGGDAKGVSFDEVADLIAKKAKAVVLLGKDRDMIRETLNSKGFDRIRFADGIERAAEIAYGLAGRGDLVLLSPACSSLDMYSSYEERGRRFKETVLRLTDGIEQ